MKNLIQESATQCKTNGYSRIGIGGREGAGYYRAIQCFVEEKAKGDIIRDLIIG